MSKEYWLVDFKVNKTKCAVCRRVMSALPFTVMQCGLGGASVDMVESDYHYICSPECRASYNANWIKFLPVVQ